MQFILVNKHQVFPAQRKRDWNNVQWRSVKVLVCLPCHQKAEVNPNTFSISVVQASDSSATLV